jgi:hypothetical protein
MQLTRPALSTALDLRVRIDVRGQVNIHPGVAAVHRQQRRIAAGRRRITCVHNSQQPTTGHVPVREFTLTVRAVLHLRMVRTEETPLIIGHNIIALCGRTSGTHGAGKRVRLRAPGCERRGPTLQACAELKRPLEVNINRGTAHAWYESVARI